MIVLSLIPIIYSLNRGVWFGLIISLGYLIYRLARHGDLRALIATLIVLPIAALAFTLTPLHDVVSNRASHSGSVSIRGFLDAAAFHGAEQSPILGWGSTRKSIGSSSSISVGPSPKCPNCGAQTIGSTGEFWQIIFSQGFVGIAFYFAFFIAAFWAIRRDKTSIGAVARLIIILTVFYTWFYANLPSALAFAFISIGLSWRSITTVRRAAPTVEPAAPRLVGATT